MKISRVRKTFILVISCILVVFIALFAIINNLFFDKVVLSLGWRHSKVFYTSGGFQDFTDYAKYTYKDADLNGNRYFEQITDESGEKLKAHIDNFEHWVDAIERSDPNNELAVNYDFDRSIISSGDYVYIYNDPDYSAFANYDVYFFDIETNTLYYFHNDT